MLPAEIRASLRQRAEDCLRVSRKLPNIEHEFRARDGEFAELAERLAAV